MHRKPSRPMLLKCLGRYTGGMAGKICFTPFHSICPNSSDEVWTGQGRPLRWWFCSLGWSFKKPSRRARWVGFEAAEVEAGPHRLKALAGPVASAGRGPERTANSCKLHRFAPGRSFRLHCECLLLKGWVGGSISSAPSTNIRIEGQPRFAFFVAGSRTYV